MPRINVWYTTELFNDSAAQDAVEAIDDCLNQLNRAGSFNTSNRGELTGNWDSTTTYDEYRDEFVNQISKTQGDAHCLIYDRNLIQGFSFTDTAAAGFAYGELRSDTAPGFLINADVSNYDQTTFENFAKHEFLHLILDQSEAPVPGNEHSFGTQYHEGGDLSPTEVSPMLTGYVEDIRGGNEKPAQCCGQSSVNNADFHTGTLSNCTKTQARDWIDNVY